MRTVLLFVFVWGCLIHHSQELAKKFEYESNVDSLGIYDTDLLPASFHKENRKKVRALMPNTNLISLTPTNALIFTWIRLRAINSKVRFIPYSFVLDNY